MTPAPESNNTTCFKASQAVDSSHVPDKIIKSLTNAINNKINAAAAL
jgi:hypothetical protein